MTIDRAAQVAAIHRLLRRAPVVAILGARQVGKTTLAADTRRTWTGPTAAFDLENPADLARLTDPLLALGPRRGLSSAPARLRSRRRCGSRCTI